MKPLIDSTQIIKQLKEIANGFECVAAAEEAGRECNCFHSCPDYHYNEIQEAYLLIEEIDFPVKFYSIGYVPRKAWGGEVEVWFHVENFGDQRFTLGRHYLEDHLGEFFEYINYDSELNAYWPSFWEWGNIKDYPRLRFECDECGTQWTQRHVGIISCPLGGCDSHPHAIHLVEAKIKGD